MKKKQILQILGVIVSIVVIIFLIRDLNDAEKKARVIAEKTVNEKGIHGALNAMPYIASIGIYNDINRLKYTDEELREVVVARYTEAEANYYDKCWINTFFILVLCFVTLWLLSFFLDPSFRKNYPWQISFCLIGLVIGIIFVKLDREKHVDQFEKEKTALLEKAKQKELTLNYTIDSLKAEIVYLKSEKILGSAQGLEDLGAVARLLDSDLAGFDSYGLNRKLHPDVFHKLWTLGQKFFTSEVRTISSRKELEIFDERYKLVGNIVPVYSMDLSGETFGIYYEKIAKFRGQR